MSETKHTPMLFNGMPVITEEMERALELVEANIVAGDIDDDTAVVNTAGLIADISAALSSRSADENENRKLKADNERLRAALDLARGGAACL